MDSMKNYSTVKTHFETILIKHATWIPETHNYAGGVIPRAS